MKIENIEKELNRVLKGKVPVKFIDNLLWSLIDNGFEVYTKLKKSEALLGEPQVWRIEAWNNGSGIFSITIHSSWHRDRDGGMSIRIDKIKINKITKKMAEDLLHQLKVEDKNYRGEEL